MKKPLPMTDGLPKITLAVSDTPTGETERALLDETITPAYPEYDEKTNLEAMRDMRQALENRLRDPSLYEAPKAKDLSDILNAPGQFPEFQNYPAHFPENKIATEVALANDPDSQFGPAYHQYVQDSIFAATESSTPSMAGLSNAVGWVKTPAEALRHHAVQARRFGAEKPGSAAMRIHRLVKRVIGVQRSYAPVPTRKTPPAKLSVQRLSEAGQSFVAVPVSRRGGVRDLAGRREAGGAAGLGAAGSRIGGEFAAIGRQMMAGWRHDVAALRAAASLGGAGWAALRRAGASLAAMPGRLAGGSLAAMPGRQAGGSYTGGRLGSGGVAGAAAMLAARRRLSGQSIGSRLAVAADPSRAAGVTANGFARIGAGSAMGSFAPRERPGAGGGAPVRKAPPANGTTMAQRGAPASPGLLPRRGASVGGDGQEASQLAVPDAAPRHRTEIARLMQDYFHRQSRMPPSAATGFDPLLTPAWAGVAMPG